MHARIVRACCADDAIEQHILAATRMKPFHFVTLLS
jgi:hypothetical protein